VDIGLGWLSDFVRWVSRIFPRGLHVDATQEGVMLTLSRAKRIRPGFHIYWPPIQRPMVHPVKRDSFEVGVQTLPHRSERPIGICISVTVVYTIGDIMKALVDTYNFPSTIKDRAQGAVIGACIGKTITELADNHQKINAALTRRMRKALDKYGVEVEEAFMSDFHLSNMHRVHGGTTVLPMDAAEEEEEEEE